MAQFALIYKSNQAFDWSTLPAEQIQEIMGAWGAWSGSLGSAIQTSGAFKFGGKSVTKSGTATADNLMGGFTVVEAEDFDAATKLAESAPSVVSGQGSMEVYEILPLNK